MYVFHSSNILLFVLLVDQDVQTVKKDEGEVVIGNRVDHLKGNLQINDIILLLHVIPTTVYQFVNIIFIKVAMQKISPPFLNMDDEVV